MARRALTCWEPVGPASASSQPLWALPRKGPLGHPERQGTLCGTTILYRAVRPTCTGLNPGAHGIFDFLARDPQSYVPIYALADVEPPKHVLKLFGYQLSLDGGTITNRRVGTPFWFSASPPQSPCASTSPLPAPPSPSSVCPEP